MGFPANPLNLAAAIGAAVLSLIRDLGRWAIFLADGLRHIFTRPWQLAKITQQVFFIGYKSLSIILLTSAFTGMVLGLQGYYTLVRLKIQNGIVLHDDVIASVKTSGLIGDKFIKLTPGGTGEALKSGGTIMDTESALDIEELVGKFVFGNVNKEGTNTP